MSTQHGTLQRGLDSTRSHLSQGRFGRMFRALPAAGFGADERTNMANLHVLAEAMKAPAGDVPKDGTDDEESGIPALYTYFGQFLDHDITFDPVSSLTQMNDPDGLVDFRTPAFDLDGLYGRGPDDQPYMYDKRDKTKAGQFLLGDPLTGTSDAQAQDLLRNGAQERAIIGDPRNDENAIVSQLHGLLQRAHNRLMEKHKDFEVARQQLRFHYQYVIVHDFLERIIKAPVLEHLKADDDFGIKRFSKSKLKFFKWDNLPFMPTEFSVAVYRLGHSMVRPGYRLNDGVAPIPTFAGPTHASLGGFRKMTPDRAIDWGRFVDTDLREYGDDSGSTPVNKKRLQLAYRLDTSLVNPLAHLKAAGVVSDDPPSLAERNLLRGWRFGLPSGQDVARYMGVTPLTDTQIKIGKHGGTGSDTPKPISTLGVAAFEGNCPLWTYILAEAMHNATDIAPPVLVGGVAGVRKISTPQMGEVGGRIVAEVFLGLLFGDNSSYLTLHPKFVPKIGGVETTDFKLRDLVNFALGKIDLW